MNHFSAIVLALGIGTAGHFVSDAIIEFKRDRTVDMRGLAERSVKANEGYWDIRFRVTAPDLEKLHVLASKSQDDIETFLVSKGFGRDKIRRQTVITSDNVSNYSRDNSQPRYSASGALTVNSTEVDRIDSASTSTSELLSKGVIVESSTVRFMYTNLNSVKPEMLREATSNAREAAEGFARDSQTELGKLRSASQGLFTITAPGQEYDDQSAIEKRVRVVTRVTFDLR